MTYSLRPIKKENMNAIKEWRNAQIRYLRQKQKLSDHDQEKYWKEVLLPSFSLEKPEQVLYSFFKDEAFIGYGGLTHIDWQSKRAEVSFLMDPARVNTYQEDFKAFLVLLKDKAFKEIGLHRLFTETFDIRPLHVKVLEESGFRAEGRLKDHVQIEGNYVDSLIHGCVNNGK